ncbi:MAG TPA: response regulator, partial [Thiotrichaceae bacterium]|nr:response regulator [Thiotrichaceae bacterium]
MPKILLVEEAERRFDRLPRRLELNDFIVYVVRKESERKKRAHNDSPDLILIDMDLTVKSQNGQRVIKELKSDEVTKSIPIIALTRSETEIEQAKAAGCDDYEPYPVELPRLLEKI